MSVPFAFVASEVSFFASEVSFVASEVSFVAVSHLGCDFRLCL